MTFPVDASLDDETHKNRNGLPRADVYLMVLSPDDLEKYVAEDESRLVPIIVAADKILLDQVTRGKNYPLRVECGTLGGGLYEKAVLERYRANGWKIDLRADGLNPDWYDFKPKDPKRS